MADQDINFRLNTTADTSGAEDAAESIRDAGKASEEAVQQSKKAADEADAANKKAAENAQVAQINTRLYLEMIGRAVTTMQAYGKALKDNAADLDFLTGKQKELASAIGEGVERVGEFGTAAAQGFQAGGPIGAVVGGAVNALKQILTAGQEVNAELEKEQEAIRKSGEASSELTRIKLRMPLAIAAEEASKLLDEVYEKALRNQKIGASEDSLQASQASQQNKAAVAAGTLSQSAANALDIESNTVVQINAINAAMDNMAAELNKVRGEAEKARTAAAVLAQGSPEQTKALEEAKKLQDQATALAKQYEQEQIVASNKIAEIKGEGIGGVREAAAKGLDEITAAVKQERDALAAEVQRLGPNASNNAKVVLEMYNKLLADGEIDATELGRVAEQQGRIRGLQEASNAKVIEAFNLTTTMMSSYQNHLTGVFTRLSALESKLNGLNQTRR